jgi:hypothetical protein
MAFADEGIPIPWFPPVIDQVLTHEYFISVGVPVLVSFIAVYANKRREGTRLSKKHWLIGSELVVCFIAIFFIHFLRVYRADFFHTIKDGDFRHLVLWNGIMLGLTVPILFSCIGTEKATLSGLRPLNTFRVAGDIALGSIPLTTMAYFLTV